LLIVCADTDVVKDNAINKKPVLKIILRYLKLLYIKKPGNKDSFPG